MLPADDRPGTTVFPAHWAAPTPPSGWATFVHTAVANHAYHAAAEGVRHLLDARLPDRTPDYQARITGARLCDHFGLREYV